MGKEVDRDYEALLENYEDALMRVVMYRVAQEDGRRLLKEAEELERSGFEVPRELDEKCLKLIEKSCASAKRKTASVEAGAVEDDSPRRLRLHKVGQMFVAAILAAILLFGVAYALNDDFRVSVLNFFLELKENGTEFFFHGNGTEHMGPGAGSFKQDAEFPFEFTYIPDGYELLQEKRSDFGENRIGWHCRYGHPNDEFNNFYFDIHPIDESTGLLVDTEDAIVTSMNIHGHEGWQVQKTDAISSREMIMFFWFDLENGEYFNYASIGISYEESIKIFHGIVIHK